MIDVDGILDVLDIAAKAYPMKALAPEIGKAESTLRAELTQQEGYKLGLITAINIMGKTYNLKALDIIEAHFGRVAFMVPRQEGTITQVMKMVASLAKEFSETMGELAAAMADGVVTETEARKCLKENEDLIKICAQLKAYLTQFIEVKAMI